MPNQINLTPEFTPNDGEEEVKQGEGQLPEETLLPQEEPAEGTEPTGEQEAVKPEGETVVSEDTTEAKKQVTGLEWERQKLLEEIKSLRGERRDIKQQEIDKVDNQLVQKKDDLAEFNPDDVTVIERIARAKGLVSKAEVEQMVYKTLQDQSRDEFLNKYPEFKPENDPNDIKWNVLMREYRLYRPPQNPRETLNLLEKARRTVMPASASVRDLGDVQKRIKTASAGTSGNSPRASSGSSLTADQKENLRRGGWTDEEIRDIEKRT